MRLSEAFADALSATGWTLPIRHGVVVALIDVADWSRWRGDAGDLLDDAESARVNRQRRVSEQETRVVAYACHRLLLGAALGRAPREVPLIRDALGCPRLSDRSLQTSLSHADGHVALAVATGHPVGVDIEPLSRAASMAEIAGHVCHPDESRSLSALPDEARNHALLALWVRKEALLKSAGVGLGREMRGFAAPTGVALAAVENGPASTVVRMLDAGPLCCAAIAAGAGQPVRSAWLRPT